MFLAKVKSLYFLRRVVIWVVLTFPCQIMALEYLIFLFFLYICRKWECERAEGEKMDQAPKIKYK